MGRYVIMVDISQMGSKDIFHLEAFVAKVMSIYKRFLIELFG